jgi:hypothetical protein
MPKIFPNISLYSTSQLLTPQAETKINVNTIEKPNIKNKILINTRKRKSYRLPLFNSSMETPEINDKYPGTNGNTQGEKNDNNPAMNANPTVMSVKPIYSSKSLVVIISKIKSQF